ncbi:MAG: DUF7674 family protein [Acidimicrobiales bacterium]
MRPATDNYLVDLLRANLPEFEGRYAELVEAYGDDLGAAFVFDALAVFVAPMMDEPWEHEPLLLQCFDALEEVAMHARGDADTAIGFGFLDGLPPAILDRVRPWLGPQTSDILDELEAGGLDPDIRLAEEMDDYELPGGHPGLAS